jgi:hypothetical protein
LCIWRSAVSGLDKVRKRAQVLPGLDKTQQLIRRHWPRIEKALGKGTAHFFNDFVLLDGFDALNH